MESKHEEQYEKVKNNMKDIMEIEKRYSIERNGEK